MTMIDAEQGQARQRKMQRRRLHPASMLGTRSLLAWAFGQKPHLSSTTQSGAGEKISATAVSTTYSDGSRPAFPVRNTAV